jgi:hypothetical protein
MDGQMIFGKYCLAKCLERTEYFELVHAWKFGSRSEVPSKYQVRTKTLEFVCIDLFFKFQRLTHE